MHAVNVRGMKANDPRVLYCGRACHGWHGSVLANPVPLDDEALRDEAVDAYEGWLWDRLLAGDRVLLAALEAIPEGAALGCWCAPKRCHTEAVIRAARLAREALV
jgi:hypothetical protein